MEILGRIISDKTSQLISEFSREFHYPVKYCDLATLGIHSSAFGAVSGKVVDGFHDVYISTRINNSQFETTVLHELRHIHQLYIGFPILCNKTGNPEFSANPVFFEQLGAKTQSALFDIDGVQWLELNGYSSSIFSAFKPGEDLSSAIAAVSHKSLEDKYNLAEASLTLHFNQFRADEFARQTLLNTFREYPEILLASESISNMILPQYCSSALYVALTLCAIVDSFSMWPVYYVCYAGKRIRTSKEYRDFALLHNADVKPPIVPQS